MLKMRKDQRLILTAGCVGLFAVLLLVARVVNGDANQKCCYQVNKDSACSGCIGWDDNGDGTIDWYMKIGDHGSKKCKSGQPTDNCDDTSTNRVCTTIPVGTTKYSDMFCLVSIGVTTVAIDLKIKQCSFSTDTQCAGG